MNNIIRHIALFIRRRSEQKQVQSVLRRFDEWRLLLEQLPKQNQHQKKLAIVRLDDIGDYLLWRNFIKVYKASERFKGYEITLIGNVVWKSIFDAYDSDTVDDTIWVDKHQYFASPDYRMQLWQNIRNQHFSTVVCPSRSRPLLLDDMMLLAADAPTRIGAHNSFEAGKWNSISDALYNEHFTKAIDGHEWHFNRAFAALIAQNNMRIERISLLADASIVIKKNQVICFIGAAAKSKTWPLAYWVELVNLLQQNGYEPLLAGGKNEMQIADKIVATTQAKSIVGQTNLVETLQVISGAAAVITGDTMAAHAAVSFNKFTVILANGVNAKRFVAYEEAGFEKVKTIYTREYLNSPKEKFYKAVTKDMESIIPSQILAALQGLLQR
ncbi:MAG: glycosyltransferase family 9 protein [Bacteroidota bacterium]